MADQEQQSDRQRAEDLYLLAEKKYHESPDDATLLHTMALALVTSELCQLNEQIQPLYKDIAMLRETIDTAMKALTGRGGLYQRK
jgi:hypothetical protein